MNKTSIWATPKDPLLIATRKRASQFSSDEYKSMKLRAASAFWTTSQWSEFVRSFPSPLFEGNQLRPQSMSASGAC
ncbi:hypothetical protein VTI28DRAFT_4401 [Corynascus sepedonium]